MKKILTSAFFLISFTVSAQNKNTLKIGINRCIYGSGDYWGYEFYNELLIPFKPHITVAPSFHIGYGSNAIESSSDPRLKTTSMGFDAMIYVSPCKFQKSKIQIGIGPSLRYFEDGSPNIYGYNIVPLIPNSPYNYKAYRFEYLTKPTYWRLGYSAVVDGELIVSPKWAVGGRVSFSNYSVDVISQFGLSFSRRF